MSAPSWIKESLADVDIHDKGEIAGAIQSVREHHDANCPAHLAVQKAVKRWNADPESIQLFLEMGQRDESLLQFLHRKLVKEPKEARDAGEE